jgi:hypothetical protein
MNITLQNTDVYTEPDSPHFWYTKRTGTLYVISTDVNDLWDIRLERIVTSSFVIKPIRFLTKD